MSTIRKFALGLLLAVAALALVAAASQFWNYSAGEFAPAHTGSDAGEQARILQGRVEALTGRVGDMQLLVLLLLATSGLYAIVFVASSYLSARSFGRQADRTIDHIKDEIRIARDDLRELQDQTERGLSSSGDDRPAEAARTAEEAAPNISLPDVWELQLTNMSERATHWKGKSLSDHDKLELLRYESEAAYLEIAGGRRLALAVARLYRNFAGIYAASDSVRTRFYLNRALILSFAEPQLASEVRYDLACWFAGVHDFDPAMRELAAAFERQSTALDARLATDLEEGGRLYELASTPPFDKRLNDLLLNVSIP